MPLRADDEEAASLAHLFRFLGNLLLIFLVKLSKSAACIQNLLIVCLRETSRLADEFLTNLHAAHLRFSQVFGVTAKHDIRAAARHIRGDRHRAELTGLGNDLRFLLMIFRIEHFMLDTALFEHRAQKLGLFNGDRAHQHRLALFMALLDLVNHSFIFRFRRCIHCIRVVVAHHRLIGRDFDGIELINLLEFLALRHCRAGHTGELFIQAEIILEGDGRKRLVLRLNLHALLGLDRLVQALAIAAAEHDAAGELIHNEHLPILHHIIHIALHYALRADSHVDVVLDCNVVEIHEVVHMKVGFRLFHSLFGEHGRFGFFINDIVGVRLFLGVFLRILLLDAHHLQTLGELIRLAVKVGGSVALTGDNQRRARFVDQDRVHFIDDAEIMATLHLQLFIGHHIITQVVKAHLVVCAVGDIRRVGFPALRVVFLMDNQADLQPQEAVNLAHPLRVTPGEVIIDRDDMHPLAG